LLGVQVFEDVDPEPEDAVRRVTKRSEALARLAAWSFYPHEKTSAASETAGP